MSTPDLPEFLVIGHICQDRMPDGSLSLGGSVSYAATTALQMGCRVGVITSTGPELDLNLALPGVQIVRRESAVTTEFENIYHNGERTQYIHQRAEPIRCCDIPTSWRSAPMVYLGSIDREIEPEVFSCFSDDSLVCVMPQGFFRQWDETGLISFTEWSPPTALLRRINVLVLSELDVPDPDALVRDWRHLVEILVITHAERGATVYQGNEHCTYPARPAQEVDLTGAGDVFAAAFLFCLAETGDPCRSAGFANIAASYSIEGRGVVAIPPRQQVEAYLKANEAHLSPQP